MSAMTLGSTVRDLYGASLTCLSPHVIYVPGEHKRVDAATGRVERSTVPCGRCRVCSASRKATWTGRLVAEALTAKSVAFVTLTYADEQEAFHYEHVQAMLKVFRINLWRVHGIKVRFFCVGERGEKRGRIHWHLLFFFDGRVPGGLHDCPIQPTKTSELWHFDGKVMWPHGWTSIFPLPEEQFTARARYCAKYAVKDYVDPRSVMRCSLKPGIGHAYLMRHAEDIARAGLVPHGGFKVPGIYVRGQEAAGVLFDHKLSGATARAFIDRWSDLYFALYPDARYPANRFLRNFDDNYVEPKPTARLDWRTIADGNVRAPGLSRPASGWRPGQEASLLIRVGRDVAHLYVNTLGQAHVDVDGTWYQVTDSISDALVLHTDDAFLIDKWLSDVRSGTKMGKHYGETQKEREAWRKLDAIACTLERKARLSADPRCLSNAQDARRAADEAFNALGKKRPAVGTGGGQAHRREVGTRREGAQGTRANPSGAELLAAQRRREGENAA